MPLRIDLHNHTCFSRDSRLTPLRLLEVARARGIDCLAVTDHDTVEGALECLRLSRATPGLPYVIPGIEVRSVDGEVIGLFVERTIPKGLSARETVQHIRDQGGLVYVPHPYDRIRGATISEHALEEILPEVDIIEVANGRARLPWANHKALLLAGRCAARLGAGSDAHFAGEVGRCYLEIASSDHGRAAPWLRDPEMISRDPSLFLAVLARARPVMRDHRVGFAVSWGYALATGMLKAHNQIRSRLSTVRTGN